MAAGASREVEPLATREQVAYSLAMQILIRFADKDTEQKALGKLIPRFSGKSWANGETMVPDAALPFLVLERIPFAIVRTESERPTEAR